ncbi:MAG: hypothetical protein IPH82_28030 [Chloroflexi bacterium]|nr:hypothetical protein [Chloroflexota bacterium]
MFDFEGLTFDLADYTFDPADFTSYTVINSENGIGCVTCGGASPAPTGRRRYCCNAPGSGHTGGGGGCWPGPSGERQPGGDG